MSTDCAIIGAGAAGLMAAIAAAEKKANVILIEHNSRVGSKILQTGNGKCNITNMYMDKSMYQNSDSDFVMSVIKNFNVEDTLGFFHSIGVFTKEKNGYVYPNSETASSVLDALRFQAQEMGCEIITDCNVKSIVKQNSNFKIVSDKGEIQSKSLIICCGSKASPKSGSDGTGYDLAKKMGHSVVKPLPALVQLISNDKLCKSMAGVRSTGNVSIFSDGKLLSSDKGEIQYTEYGISGIPVFQVSRYAVKAIDKKKEVFAVIDMIPDICEETLADNIKTLIKGHPDREIIQLLSCLINKKLLHAALFRCNIKDNDKSCQLSGKKVSQLVEQLKGFVINITGSKMFDNAQVCQGGVKLNEINSNTMESKIVKNLFFAGEILDVDGKCGGYNLQWAWSSGHLAGLNAGKVK